MAVIHITMLIMVVVVNIKLRSVCAECSRVLKRNQASCSSLSSPTSQYCPFITAHMNNNVAVCNDGQFCLSQ